jgi:serine/threonine protein kinase
MADENKTICVPVKRLVKGGDVSWEILDPKPLYDGDFSTVYKGCYKGKCDHILKFAVDNVKEEVEFQKKCAENGLCIDVDDWWDCSSGDGGVIITRMLDKTIKTHLVEISQDEQIQVVKNILEMIQKLHGLDIKHGDLHLGNIMTDKNGKLYFIDMGHSMNIKKTTSYSQSAMSDYEKFILNIYSISKDGNFQDTLDFITPLAIITRLSQDLRQYNVYIDEDELISTLFVLLGQATFSIDTKRGNVFKGRYDSSKKRISWSLFKKDVLVRKGYYEDGKLIEMKSFIGNDKGRSLVNSLS